MQEYKRCAHALRKVGGPRASFLRCYATYLLGEARKEEERLEAGGLLGNGQAVNKVPSHVIRAQNRGFGLLPGRSCSEACCSRQRFRHAIAYSAMINGCHECCSGRCPVSQASFF